MNAVTQAPVFHTPGSKPPLWGEIDIPIIIGTGPFGSGKTLFGASIAPGPETLAMDQEGSLLTYRSIGFDHIDMAVELTKIYPDGFTPIQRWEWFKKESIARGKTGKYRVLMVDPASEIEDGLEAYIRANLPKYGLSSDQVRKASGLLWGVMKREWKLHLDMLRAYYETIYLTVHLRNEYQGNIPTGKKEPKGKETLFELASLFLWFDRSPDKSGKVPAKPSAKVLKSRLATTKFVEGELVTMPVLPPHLEVATPIAIRQYIANPPDYSKLKKSELLIEPEMTDAEKLRIQSQIAADTREAAQAELSRVELMSRAAERSNALQNLQSQAPDQSGAIAQNQAVKAQATANDNNQPVAAADLERIKGMFAKAFASDEEVAAWAPGKLQELGIGRFSDMTKIQAIGLEGDLSHLIFKRSEEKTKAMKAELDSQPAEQADTIPFTPNVAAENKVHHPDVQEAADAFGGADAEAIVSEETVKKIKEVIGQAFGSDAEAGSVIVPRLQTYGAAKIPMLKESQASQLLDDLADTAISRKAAMERLRDLCEETKWDHNAQMEWLKKSGLASFRGCTMDQLAERIGHLEKTAAAFAGGAPKN